MGLFTWSGCGPVPKNLFDLRATGVSLYLPLCIGHSDFK
jgi:hypothetical protein